MHQPLPRREPQTPRMRSLGVLHLAIFPRFAVAFFGHDPRLKVQISRAFAQWLIHETDQVVPAKR